MAKRFTDSDKYRNPFIRSLPPEYKLFWDYIYHECNHAGIWREEIDVAQIRLGAEVDKEKALQLFNEDEERVIEINEGKKWYIKPFIDFQYGGNLDPKNRVHKSVIKILKKEGIFKEKSTGVSVGSQKYLVNIPQKDIEQLKEKFGWPEERIRNKAEDLLDWLKDKGKRRKNHKAFLTRCIRKDAETEKERNQKNTPRRVTGV